MLFVLCNKLQVKTDTFIINIWQFLCQESQEMLSWVVLAQVSHETLVEVLMGLLLSQGSTGAGANLLTNGWKPSGTLAALVGGTSPSL